MRFPLVLACPSKDRLLEPFQMLDVRAKITEMTPYVICGLQELEKINAVLIEMDRALSELELGLVGNDKILAYRKETGCKPQKPAGIGKKTHKVQGRPKGSLNKVK